MSVKDKLRGIFPWMKKPKSDTERAEDMLKLYMKHLPELRRVMSNSVNPVELSDGQILGRMYDFYQDADRNTGLQIRAWRPDGDNESEATEEDKRTAKKPVEVVDELERVPTPWNSEESELEAKIALFKSKSRLVNQRYAKDQIEGFTQRLENRKHYKDHVEFFAQFPNTTDEKIDALLEKYKLEMNESELFIPTFPKEAIDVMSKYSEVCAKFTNQVPVFYVIAEEKDFAAKRKKLDPILLVQSPFGFYWQILGAWDEEMLLLHEL